MKFSLKKRSKYNNIKVEVDGIMFASKKEAGRYLELKLLERAGVIKNLQLQKIFLFKIDNEYIKYRSGRKVTYVADFVYTENGKEVVEDVKGKKTREYMLKEAFMRALNNIKIKEIRSLKDG